MDRVNMYWTTKWHYLTEIKVSKFSVPEEPGVYEIRCMQNRKIKIIHRCKDHDKAGILYIGESSNLRERIMHFYRSIMKTEDIEEKHSGAKTYFRFWDIPPLNSVMPRK